MAAPARVAFLGPEGTYTHQALLQQFGKDPTKVQVFPQTTIGDCFQQVNDREVDYAVVPFENSTNGQVVFTYDLLRDWFFSSEQAQQPTFGVVAEQFVAIHHYVFSNAADLSQVNRLYSHPQVWGQVSRYLQQEKFNGQCERIDVNSTAEAARLVSEDDTNTSACISSAMSGVLHGLPAKACEIEDIKHNTTRFLVLGYGEKLAGEEPPKNSGNVNEQRCVTSMMLMLNDNDPGALCAALHSFRANGINLSSIASRPSRVLPWEYVFFVEAEGEASGAAMRQSVEMLRTSCSKVVVLGSFVRSWRFRH